MADLNGSWSFHSGCFWCENLHAIHGKRQLEIHRLLGPQRAVVVERRDPFAGRDEIRSAFPGDLGHEVQDRLLRPAIVPRRKRVGGLRERL